MKKFEVSYVRVKEPIISEVNPTYNDGYITENCKEVINAESEDDVFKMYNDESVEMLFVEEIKS